MLALAIHVLAARRAMGHTHLWQRKGSHLPEGVTPPSMASTCLTPIDTNRDGQQKYLRDARDRARGASLYLADFFTWLASHNYLIPFYLNISIVYLLFSFYDYLGLL